MENPLRKSRAPRAPATRQSSRWGARAPSSRRSAGFRSDPGGVRARPGGSRRHAGLRRRTEAPRRGFPRRKPAERGLCVGRRTAAGAAGGRCVARRRSASRDATPPPGADETRGTDATPPPHQIRPETQFSGFFMAQGEGIAQNPFVFGVFSLGPALQGGGGRALTHTQRQKVPPNCEKNRPRKTHG